MIGVVYVKHKFQSTLPVRGATQQTTKNADTTTISIHAPREGSDNLLGSVHCYTGDFNPRSP